MWKTGEWILMQSQQAGASVESETVAPDTTQVDLTTWPVPLVLKSILC